MQTERFKTSNIRSSASSTPKFPQRFQSSPRLSSSSLEMAARELLDLQNSELHKVTHQSSPVEGLTSLDTDPNGSKLLPPIQFAKEKQQEEMGSDIDWWHQRSPRAIHPLLPSKHTVESPPVFGSSPTYASLPLISYTPPHLFQEYTRTPFNIPGLKNLGSSSPVTDSAGQQSPKQEILPHGSSPSAAYMYENEVTGFSSTSSEASSIQTYEEERESPQFTPTTKSPKNLQVTTSSTPKNLQVTTSSSLSSIVVTIKLSKKATSVNRKKSTQQPVYKQSLKRSKSGCWTCRVRHKACPEERPSCSLCERLGLKCDYSKSKPAYMYNPKQNKKKLAEIKNITTALKRSGRGRKSRST